MPLKPLPGFNKTAAFPNKTALLAMAANLPSVKNVSSLKLGAAKQATLSDVATVKSDIEAAVQGKAGVTAARIAALTQAKGAAVGLAASHVAEYKCIKTPAEYMAAFHARDIGRCVDADLFARLANNANATTSQTAATTFSNRPAFFWTGNDGLAKYLRYGAPLSVGNGWPQTGGPPGCPKPIRLRISQGCNNSATVKPSCPASVTARATLQWTACLH